MTVKRARQRQSEERTVETRFELWSLCRCMIFVRMSYNCEGKGSTYHRDESNSEICKTQKSNSDAAP